MRTPISADVQILADVANDAERLSVALLIWRRSRCPMIGRWIEVLGERVNGPVWPQPCASPTGLAHRIWLIATAQTTAAAVRGAEALLRQPPDPRMTTWGLAFFDAPTTTVVSSRRFWHAMVDLLHHGLSAGHIDRLDAVTGRWGVRLDDDLMLECARRALQFERIVGHPLSAVDAQIVKQLAVPDLLGPTHDVRHAHLLAAALSRTDDLSARAVLGDYLMTLGDPQGEFISLQLMPQTAESRGRQTALLKAHLVDWVAPLGAGQSCTFIQFQDGFASHIVLDAGSRADPFLVCGPEYSPAVGHLRWITVSSVSVVENEAGPPNLGCLMVAPARHALRRWAGVCPFSCFWDLAEGAPLDLIAISAWVWVPSVDGLDDDGRQMLRHAPGLPHLKILHLEFDDRISDCIWFLRTSLARRLDQLAVRCPMAVLPSLPRYLGRGQLTRFDLHVPETSDRVRLARRDGAWTLTAAVRRRHTLEALCMVLQEMAPDWLTAAQIEMPDFWGADARASLSVALGHQGGLSTIVWKAVDW